MENKPDFEFEGKGYVFTPRAIHAIDQAKAMLRDGMDFADVALAIGIPGETEADRVLGLTLLLNIWNQAGRD